MAECLVSGLSFAPPAALPLACRACISAALVAAGSATALILAPPALRVDLERALAGLLDDGAAAFDFDRLARVAIKYVRGRGEGEHAPLDAVPDVLRVACSLHLCPPASRPSWVALLGPELTTLAGAGAGVGSTIDMSRLNRVLALLGGVPGAPHAHVQFCSSDTSGEGGGAWLSEGSPLGLMLQRAAWPLTPRVRTR